MTDFNSKSCYGSIENFGTPDCLLALVVPAYLAFATTSQQFTTKASAQTQADWQTAIQAKSIFPIRLPILEPVDNSEEDGAYKSPNGLVSINTSKGKWDMSFRFQMDPFLYSRMYSLNGKSGRLYMCDDAGNVMATTPDNIKVNGYSVKNVQVSKPKLATGKDDVTTFMVRFFFDNLEEYTKKIASFEVDFFDELNGLLDAEITYISSNVAKTEHTVSVRKLCDGSPVVNLVAADFTISDDTPTVEAITSSAETQVGISGDYVLTTSALGADNYTVNLNNPATMTTDGYESTGSDTFTIV